MQSWRLWWWFGFWSLWLPMLSVGAEEYHYTKSCNPGQLAKELTNQGIQLLGNDQIGYLHVLNGSEITIVTPTPLTDSQQATVEAVIQAHKPKNDKIEEAARKQQIAQAKLHLKNNEALTQEEVDALFGP